MSTVHALLLAASLLGLLAVDWWLNDAGVLIFAGRKMILTVETLAVWR